MKPVLTLLAIIVFSSPLVFAGEITFKNHGKLVKKLALTDFAKIGEAQEVTVSDPNEGNTITYKAYPANEILKKIFGPNWIKNKEVLFTCLDGYKPSVPMEQFKKATAYFAVERSNSDFSITKKADKKKISVGPLYLVWKGEAAGVFWPYQLATVDLWPKK